MKSMAMPLSDSPTITSKPLGPFQPSVKHGRKSQCS